MPSIRRIALIVTAVVTTGLLVSCGGTTPKMKEPPPEPDTSPSFGTQTIPAIPPLPVRVALPIPIPLPAAAGGNGDLTYTVTPIPPGLSFDPATRTVSGMPVAVGSYDLTYSATDEDGDIASLTFAVVVMHSKVYWTDFDNGTIMSANLDGTGVTEHLSLGTVVEPHGIALDVANGKMYWAEYNTSIIGRANLDGSEVEKFDVAEVSGQEGLNLRSLDLDLAGRKMYWSSDQGSIYRANLDVADGIEFEEIVSDLSFVTAIALDPIGRRIYWIDDAGDVIQSAKLDGSDIRTVTTSGLAAPYGLAVDPVNQKLYWTHGRSDMNVTRSNLDGTELEHIVTEADVDEPAEITVDAISQKIYWAERGGTIRRANLDGTDIEAVVSDLPLAYGIALH